MDALTPSSPATTSSVAAPAPAPRPAAPQEHRVAVHPPQQPTEPLPALPLSVQRTSLEAHEAPAPKVMTKEQMAALLDLVV